MDKPISQDKLLLALENETELERCKGNSIFANAYLTIRTKIALKQLDIYIDEDKTDAKAE